MEEGTYDMYIWIPLNTGRYQLWITGNNELSWCEMGLMGIVLQFNDSARKQWLFLTISICICICNSTAGSKQSANMRTRCCGSSVLLSAQCSLCAVCGAVKLADLYLYFWVYLYFCLYWHLYLYFCLYLYLQRVNSSTVCVVRSEAGWLMNSPGCPDQATCIWVATNYSCKMHLDHLECTWCPLDLAAPG